MSDALVVTDARWWFGIPQAVNRQISLEQQLQTLKENEQALQTLQESLSQLDHTLTSYLTDRIDAFRLPQEAQVQLNTLSHGVEIQNENMLDEPSKGSPFSSRRVFVSRVFKLVIDAVRLHSHVRPLEQRLLLMSWQWKTWGGEMWPTCLLRQAMAKLLVVAPCWTTCR